MGKRLSLVLLAGTVFLTACSELAPPPPNLEFQVAPVGEVRVGDAGNYPVGSATFRLPGAPRPVVVSLSLVSPPPGVSLVSPTTVQVGNAPGSADLVLRLEPGAIFASGETTKTLELTLRGTPQSAGYSPVEGRFRLNLVRGSSTSPSNATLALDTNTLTVRAGSSGSVVAAASVQGYTGAVQVEAAGVPSGVSFTSSPATFTAPGTRALTLTFQAASNAAPGTANVEVRLKDTNGNVLARASLNLVVEGAPSLSTSLLFTNRSVYAGDSLGGLVTVSSQNFTGTVTLSYRVCDPSYTVTWSENPSFALSPNVPEKTLGVYVDIPFGASPRECTLEVTASSGSLTSTAQISFRVETRPEIKLQVGTVTLVEKRVAVLPLTVSLYGRWSGFVFLTLADSSLNPVPLNPTAPLRWDVSLNGVSLTKDTANGRATFYVDNTSSRYSAFSGTLAIISDTPLPPGTYTYYLVAQGPGGLYAIAPVTVEVR